MGLKKSLKLIGLFGLLVAIAAAAPSFERGETGQVSKVLDGDSFVLESGLEVRLAAVEAPRVRPGDIWGPRATQDLERLVLGKKVELRYDGLRRDRRGRAIAHVFVPQGLGKEAVWVQSTLLKSGLARVHTYADNRRAVGDLWQADVTAIVPETAFQRWRGGAPDILALQGRTIRVRGYVRNSNGPSVWVDHPEQIEFIMVPAAPRQQASVKK